MKTRYFSIADVSREGASLNRFGEKYLVFIK
jgi:hypothetical protein